MLHWKLPILTVRWKTDYNPFSAHRNHQLIPEIWRTSFANPFSLFWILRPTRWGRLWRQVQIMTNQIEFSRAELRWHLKNSFSSYLPCRYRIINKTHNFPIFLVLLWVRNRKWNRILTIPYKVQASGHGCPLASPSDDTLIFSQFYSKIVFGFSCLFGDSYSIWLIQECFRVLIHLDMILVRPINFWNIKIRLIKFCPPITQSQITLIIRKENFQSKWICRKSIWIWQELEIP